MYMSDLESMESDDNEIQAQTTKPKCLAESFIRAIDDPIKLQNLLVDSYRRCTSLRKDKKVKDAVHAEELRRMQEEVDSQNEAFKEGLYGQIYESIGQDFNCSICTDLFIEPQVLECGHAFCGQCIDQWMVNGQNHCPNCRKAIYRPAAKQIEMGNFMLKIHSMMSTEIQNNRATLIAQRKQDFNQMTATRAATATANPISNPLTLLDSIPRYLRYLRQNRQRVMNVGASILRFAETLPSNEADFSAATTAPLSLTPAESSLFVNILRLMDQVPIVHRNNDTETEAIIRVHREAYIARRTQQQQAQNNRRQTQGSNTVPRSCTSTSTNIATLRERLERLRTARNTLRDGGIHRVPDYPTYFYIRGEDGQISRTSNIPSTSSATSPYEVGSIRNLEFPAIPATQEQPAPVVTLPSEPDSDIEILMREEH